MSGAVTVTTTTTTSLLLDLPDSISAEVDSFGVLAFDTEDVVALVEMLAAAVEALRPHGQLR